MWLFLVLFALPLLVSQDKLDELVDPNDPEAVWDEARAVRDMRRIAIGKLAVEGGAEGAGP